MRPPKMMSSQAGTLTRCFFEEDLGSSVGWRWLSRYLSCTRLCFSCGRPRAAGASSRVPAGEGPDQNGLTGASELPASGRWFLQWPCRGSRSYQQRAQPVPAAQRAERARGVRTPGLTCAGRTERAYSRSSELRSSAPQKRRWRRLGCLRRAAGVNLHGSLRGGGNSVLTYCPSGSTPPHLRRVQALVRWVVHPTCGGRRRRGQVQTHRASAISTSTRHWPFSCWRGVQSWVVSSNRNVGRLPQCGRSQKYGGICAVLRSGAYGD